MANDHDAPPSDAELAAALRNPDSDAALDELYRRHRSAVLSYASACCRDPHTAEDLAAEAFARTLQAVRSGKGPVSAWRPYLLTIVRRTAADWADRARRTELSPDFEQWLANAHDAPGAESSEERMLRLEDSSLVLRAFRSLPERWQTVLWHTAVERDSAQKAGSLLGMSPASVSSLAYRAREGLREAYLAAHAVSDSATDECRRHSSRLGAVVRRPGRRRTKDFERHLTRCEHCRRALIELTDLNERLGSALPVAVLLFGGSAYVAARLTDTAVGTGTGALGSGSPNGALHGSTGLWAKPGVATAIATAVGVAIVLLPMPFGDHDESPQSAPLPPPVTRKDTSPRTLGTPPPHLPPSAARPPAPSSSPTPTPTLSPPTAEATPLPSPRRADRSSPTPSTTDKGPVTARHSPTAGHEAAPSYAPPPAPARSAAPPPAPPAAPPRPAPGSDFSACYHDRCQVEVTGGDTIPLDGQAGVDVLKIVGVAGNSLSYAASSGNGAQTASGSQSSPGTSTVNQLVMDILRVDGSRALIRLHKG
ncbi:RNA polymerase sigma factor [Streptomyces sp. YGL11-2]|uniref:RNA polymerase sigma factor n=1 Tax=Streptomyces sp. YGL11-2 TaxID=3414028 RepID=UPI003CEC6658